jgi:DNA helicase-2/ATP-dependent DNA helicase PcrA
MTSKAVNPSTVIPGRLEEANPEFRDSGFDAAHRPGMTKRVVWIASLRSQ